MSEESRLMVPLDLQARRRNAISKVPRGIGKLILRILLVLFGMLVLFGLVKIGEGFFQSIPLVPPIGGGFPLPYSALPQVQATPTVFPSFLQRTPIPRLQPTPALATETLVPPLKAGAQLYIHPGSTFQLYPPEGWTYEANRDSTTFTSPNSKSYLDVSVTFTGNPLDAGSMARFMDAREANLYGRYLGNGQHYQEIDRKHGPEEGTATITKILTIDGDPYIVVTSYRQKGQAIFSMDYWAQLDPQNTSGSRYLHILDSLEVKSASPAQVQVYSQGYSFTERNHIYTLEVPESWSYEPQFKENTALDTFYSPDRHAVFQGIVYNDGEIITKPLAGEFTLTLLRNYYATDIVITQDSILSNGAEQLVWYSPKGKYHGTMLFVTRDEYLLIFGSVVDDDFQDVYAEPLQRFIDNLVILSP
jgi:hypothetical protein